MKRRTLFLAAGVLVLGAAIVGLAMFRKYERTAPTEKNYPLGPMQATGSDAQEELHKTLILALDDPLDTPYGQLALTYKNEVEAMSDGTITVEIFENGLLGHCYDMLADAGVDVSADIILAPASDVAAAGCVEAEELMDAGKFKGHSEFLKWASSKNAKMLLAEPEKDGLGMKGLFLAEDGFEFLFFKDEITSVKGMRISPEANDYSDKFVEKIGGTCDHTPSIDLKAALSEGRLDGVAWNLLMYKEYGLWGAAPYIAETGRLENPYMALITQDTVEVLSDAELEILQKAGSNAVEALTDSVRQTENSILAEAGTHGAKTIDLK